MLHKLALSASVLALAGSLAVAPSGRSMAATSSLSTTHWLASDVYKADVYDNAEEKIGVVTDLIMDSGGRSRRQSLALAVCSALARKKWPFLSKT